MRIMPTPASVRTGPLVPSWTRLGGWILPVLALVGCQDYLFERKFPERIKEAQIVVPAATPTPADILFVVDNSGSMADEQENLARNFDSFINQIAGAGDYQIAIVTTDTSFGPASDPGEIGGLVTSTFNVSSPFNLLDFSQAGCAPVNIPHTCFRGPDATKRIISSMRLPDKDAQIRTFQDNVKVGSCGSGSEQGLRAMIEALSRTRGNGCNQGFLRDNANLVIVLVSDEEDDEPAVPVNQYVNDLAQYKDYSRTRVATIVGSVDGRGANCSSTTRDCGSLCRNMPRQGSHTGCTVGSAGGCMQGEFCQATGSGSQGQCENEGLRHWNATNCLWCSFYNAPDCCSALSGSRYVDFALAMEQKVNRADRTIPISNCRGQPGKPVACLIDSICQEDFGNTLARIARELVLTDTYTLDPPAKFPEGVTVRIKGPNRPGGSETLVFGRDFQISEDGATLRITAGDKTPVEGESVEIFFVVG